MIPNRRMKSRFWKLEKNTSEKKRPKKEEKRNRQSRMTLLIFLSRLQIENYVMTDFSIQPIRKERTANNVFRTTRSCCKISIFLCWWAKLVIVLVQNLNSFKEVTHILSWFRFESDIISEHIHESDEKLMEIPESWGTRPAVVSCNRSK